jgi:SAM-dependent methyltransferase
MPFPDGCFDMLWSQNTIMNIADKPRLLSETARVLRTGGLFVLEAIFAGPVSDPYFPVFWADEPSVSFLDDPTAFRTLLMTYGFREILWEDVTSEVVSMTLKRQLTLPASVPPLGLHVVYSDVPRKGANVLRNFEENRAVQIQAICTRWTREA